MQGSPLTLLSAGGGDRTLPEWEAKGYQVVRLDIDPNTSPDILASMTAMGDIGPFDAVYCCHALEHLYPHEAELAVQEFVRVVKPGGVVIIGVPDLEGVEPTTEIITEGGLTGLHLIYGDPEQVKTNPYMAHRCGFVLSTLKDLMSKTGFIELWSDRVSNRNLIGIWRKPNA